MWLARDGRGSVKMRHTGLDFFKIGICFQDTCRREGDPAVAAIGDSLTVDDKSGNLCNSCSSDRHIHGGRDREGLDGYLALQ